MDNLVWNLSIEDAIAVNNAMNEICNGVHINEWEFPIRLGVSREQLRRILQELNNMLPPSEYGVESSES